MCGIVGLISSQLDLQQTLHNMCESIRHRGPDDEGLACQGKIGIGMRRLSIIDLSGGHQPIYNEDGRFAIVFNGEIYNYVELYDELQQLGHVFQTHSDTETIVHAYEEWGPDCLQRLNGMFAFAIWDRVKGQLFIVRDRLGKKPLYYRYQDGLFAFASEVRALKQIPDLSWTVDLEAVHHYLSLQYIPTPLSIYREVRKLPPAHWLLTDGKTLTIQRYWNVDYIPKRRESLTDLQEELRHLIGEAVRLRLRSDVPLGVFLSGGLDSAVILAEMARQMSRPVEAFTIGFEEGEFNEVEYAAQVAQMHGANHHRFTVKISADNDPFMLARQLDEPFANSSALPTFYLAQQTRHHVTVALSGDGSDEVFAGYQRYVLDRLIPWYAPTPAVWGNRVVNLASTKLRVRHDLPTEANWVLGLKRIPQVIGIPRTASVLRWGSYFNEAMKQELYTPEMTAATQNLSSVQILDDDYRRACADSALDRTLYTDLMNYLPDDGHFKVDRMSMANSLEVRQPYMDVNVVEFAARLPLEAKISGLTQKALLRQAYTAVLPRSTVKRPKRGFAVPISQWFHGPLGDVTRQVVLGADAHTRQFFRPEICQRLIDEHAQRKDDHGKRLWALLILELWLREHA
jgi:asparagine synthase (glutamine-hydrolysing)